MTNFTLFDFQELTNNENKLSKLIHSEKPIYTKGMPSKRSIDNILNYSKALSIRKSNTMKYIENILN